MKIKQQKRLKRSTWKLIVQPGAGVEPLIKAIDEAKESIQILIFRFDRKEIEKALIRAVERGVAVSALIAWTNRGGETHLRRLETRFLAAGVTVSRTASDLARYHGKMMIVDHTELYLLAFNYTALDIDGSRSFGVVTTTPAVVKEAVRLFEADSNRQPYETATSTFIVSPVNARSELAKFLSGASKELMIYDPGLSDPQMVRILEERVRAGVTVRIIGNLKRVSKVLKAVEIGKLRLHTRTILRDGDCVFVGSQSLRAAELDGRREVGVILGDKRIVDGIAKVFEADWKDGKKSALQPGNEEAVSEKLARKVAKVITKEIPPVAEVIESISGDAVLRKGALKDVDIEALEETVRTAVRSVVVDTIQEAAGQPAAGSH